MKCLNCDNPAKPGSRFCCGICTVVWYRKLKAKRLLNSQSSLIAQYGKPDCECLQCGTPDGNVAHVGVADV